MTRQRLLMVLASASWMLTACAAGAPPTQGRTAIAPANLTQPCPEELPQPKDGRVKTLEANHIESARLYHLCKDRHADFVQWYEVTSEALHRSE